jgi:transcriptional regulator with XRE-family HTH domain
MSLRNVAQRAKVSPTWLSLCERDRGSLSLDALHRVCLVLRVELDDVLHDFGTPALLAERAADPAGLAELMRAVYDLEDLSGVVELVRRWRMEAL